MASARELLNELKWTTGLDGVTVTYLHRGAPGDERTVLASEIVIAHGSFEVVARPGESASIPWHRVLRVEQDGAVLWQRAERIS